MHEKGNLNFEVPSVMTRHLNACNCFSFDMNRCGPPVKLELY